jgi:hypothetical protein
MKRLVALVLMAGVPAVAGVIQVYGTGLNASSGLLNPGDIDPHYVLVSGSPIPGPAYANTPFSGWVGNTASSQWIGPVANVNSGAPPQPGAEGCAANCNYDYRTTFDLTGLNPGTALLAGSWATDNSGQIWLNGVPTSNTLVEPGYHALFSFSITSGFVAGVNTLDFIVNNFGYPPGDPNGPGFPSTNPTGLQVEFTTAQASVPEPGTIGMVLTVLVGLAVGVRRTKS